MEQGRSKISWTKNEVMEFASHLLEWIKDEKHIYKNGIITDVFYSSYNSNFNAVKRDISKVRDKFKWMNANWDSVQSWKHPDFIDSKSSTPVLHEFDEEQIKILNALKKASTSLFNALLVFFLTTNINYYQILKD